MREHPALLPTPLQAPDADEGDEFRRLEPVQYLQEVAIGHPQDSDEGNRNQASAIRRVEQ